MTGELSMTEFVAEAERKRLNRKQVTVPTDWCPFISEPTHKGSSLMKCKLNRMLCSCAIYNLPDVYVKRCPDYPKTEMQTE